MVLVALRPSTLEDACGEEPDGLCEWVWERTERETLARLADWLVGKPLLILFTLGVAWIGSRLARRWIRSAVHHVVVEQQGGARPLKRLGLVPDSVIDADDPRREVRAMAIAAVLGSTATAIIWATALLSVLDTLGLNLGPLLASAGIAGIAIGFGAQSLVRDWLAGIFMLLEDQYGIGDVVDVGEASGVVERFSLRATVLRSADGTVWHVPNGQIVRVGNRSQLWSVAVLDVVVAYDTDLEHAQRLMLDAASKVCTDPKWSDQVLEPPDLLGVEQVDGAGITLRLNVKTRPGSQWPLQRALREAVKDAFDRGGVQGPTPAWGRDRMGGVIGGPGGSGPT
jgi:small-conductance mechanosensitive channel